MSGPLAPAGSPALPSTGDFDQYTYTQVWELFKSILHEWGWDDSEKDQFQECRYNGHTLLSMELQEFVHDGFAVGLGRCLRGWLDDLEGGRKAQKRTDREEHNKRPDPKRPRANTRRRATSDSTSSSNLGFGDQSGLVDDAYALSHVIKSLTYTIDDYSAFGTELLNLPYAYVAKTDAVRFNSFREESKDIARPAFFRYYGREILRVIYEEVIALDLRKGYSMYYLHGSLGLGKSHMLAALVLALFKEKRKVVFLPDCRALARSFLATLKDGLALTYAYFDDEEALQGCLGCRTPTQLVEWCVKRSTSKKREQLFFVVDQINVQDTDSDSVNSVSSCTREECADLLAVLEQRHILIFSSSGNYLHGLKEFNKPGSQQRRSVFGGLSETEMEAWWNVLGNDLPVKVPEIYRNEVEALTGKVPMFLGALMDIPKLAMTRGTPADDVVWEHILKNLPKTTAIKMLSADISTFYDNKRSKLRLDDAPKWQKYLETCHACLTGSALQRKDVFMYDWRYFFRDNALGGATCLYAKKYLQDSMRIDVTLTDFTTESWRIAMSSSGPNNPTVLGFYTEQVLLGELARSGLSALGPDWSKHMTPVTLSTDVATIPYEAVECTKLYLPIKSTHKGIDALLLSLTKADAIGNFSAHLVPVQITIATKHSDSEAAFFRFWNQYADRFRGLPHITSVKVTFVWIVKEPWSGHHNSEIIPVGGPTLGGALYVPHPGYERRWMTVREANTSVGILLEQALNSTTNPQAIQLPLVNLPLGGTSSASSRPQPPFPPQTSLPPHGQAPVHPPVLPPVLPQVPPPPHGQPPVPPPQGQPPVLLPAPQQLVRPDQAVILD